MQKVIKIGVLGAGTVGSGVIKVLEMNRPQITERVGARLEVKQVLVRDCSKVRPFLEGIKVTDKIEDILQDEEIQIVVELMGGLKPAKEYMLRAMDAGKSVVTANKDVVAQFGKEMFAKAEEKNVDFLFEASVGGGIPIITPLKQCLTANKVTEIMGIVNGTTNYMLTKMTAEGLEFDDVLKEAQAKGYAEKDPTADIEGYDACRKIAILTSVVCGQQVNYEDIHTEGITKITATDILYAKEMNRAIKLLATSRQTNEGYVAMVAPFLIPQDHPLYNVNDVFNAIFVKGNMLGDSMFYGSGAGKLPTASAVVGDIVDMVKHMGKHIILNWDATPMVLADYKKCESKFFVRTKASKEEISNIFGKVEFVDVKSLADEIGFVTEQMTEAAYEEKAAKLPDLLQMIRLA